MGHHLHYGGQKLKLFATMKDVSTMLFLGSSIARPADDFGDNLLETISNEINGNSRVFEMDSSINDSSPEPLFLLDRPAFKRFLESQPSHPRERRFTETTTTTEQLTTTTGPEETSTVHDPDWTPGTTMDTTSTHFPTTQTIEVDAAPTTTSTTDSANDPDWEPNSTADTTSTSIPTSTTTTTTTSTERTKRNWFLEWLDNFGFNW